MNILDLPDDILFCIFYFSKFSTRKKLLLTCKYFYQLFNKNIFDNLRPIMYNSLCWNIDINQNITKNVKLSIKNNCLILSSINFSFVVDQFSDQIIENKLYFIDLFIDYYGCHYTENNVVYDHELFILTPTTFKKYIIFIEGDHDKYQITMNQTISLNVDYIIISRNENYMKTSEGYKILSVYNKKVYNARLVFKYKNCKIFSYINHKNVLKIRIVKNKNEGYPNLTKDRLMIEKISDDSGDFYLNELYEKLLKIFENKL